MHLVQERVNSYDEVLAGGVALFAASESVTREEWTAFAATLDVSARYPGLVGLGVIYRVNEADRGLFEAHQQSAIPEFVIHPVPGGQSGSEAFALTYLEPEAPFRYALGLDLASEDLRRFAAERSRDSGRTAISDPIIFTGGTGEDGFLMLKPFYAKGADVSTVEGRRSALLGWVYAPFHTADFFAGILGGGTPEITTFIFKGDTADPAQLAYGTGQGVAPGGHRFSDVRPMPLKGQLFTIAFGRSPAFAGEGKSTARLIYLFGTIASSLLGFASWLVLSSRTRAMKLAAEATLELEEAMEALRANAFVLEEQAMSLDALRLEAEFLARHDALTGVLNRRAWWEEAASMEPRSLVLFDVDHFKRVNDEFGHSAGDVVLAEVARRLVTAAAPGVVGRLGGEEFGVLFQEATPLVAETMDELVSSMAFTMDTAAGAVRVSVSAGLAPVSSAASFSAAYEAADAALYEAKASGRRTWRPAGGPAAAAA